MTKFEDLWPQAQSHTLLHRYKARLLHELMECACSMGHDVAECGVFRGSMSLMMAMQIAGAESQSPDMRLWSCDSFAGLPAGRSPAETCYYKTGDLVASRVDFEKLLLENGVRDRVVVCEGWFSETLSRLPQLGLAHVDCDVYESVRCCLDVLYEKLVPGGILVVDDYYDLGGGAQQALDELLARTHDVLYVGPIEQVVVVKGRLPSVPPESYVGWRPSPPFLRRGVRGGIDYTLVARDEEYLRDLASGSALPDFPGRSLREAAKLARRTLDVCEHHEAVRELYLQLFETR